MLHRPALPAPHRLTKAGSGTLQNNKSDPAVVAAAGGSKTDSDDPSKANSPNKPKPLDPRLLAEGQAVLSAIEEEIRVSELTATAAPVELGWLGVLTDVLQGQPDSDVIARCELCSCPVLACRLAAHRCPPARPAPEPPGSSRGAGPSRASEPLEGRRAGVGPSSRMLAAGRGRGRGRRILKRLTVNADLPPSAAPWPPTEGGPGRVPTKLSRVTYPSPRGLPSPAAGLDVMLGPPGGQALASPSGHIAMTLPRAASTHELLPSSSFPLQPLAAPLPIAPPSGFSRPLLPLSRMPSQPMAHPPGHPLQQQQQHAPPALAVGPAGGAHAQAHAHAPSLQPAQAAAAWAAAQEAARGVEAAATLLATRLASVGAQGIAFPPGVRRPRSSAPKRCAHREALSPWHVYLGRLLGAC
jgi:hypothetical protein